VLFAIILAFTALQLRLRGPNLGGRAMATAGRREAGKDA